MKVNWKLLGEGENLDKSTLITSLSTTLVNNLDYKYLTITTTMSMSTSTMIPATTYEYLNHEYLNYEHLNHIGVPQR